MVTYVSIMHLIYMIYELWTAIIICSAGAYVQYPRVYYVGVRTERNSNKLGLCRYNYKQCNNGWYEIDV